MRHPLSSYFPPRPSVLAALGLLLFLHASPLSAHPHMSFTNRFEFCWDGEALKGVYLEWSFDKFFSSDIIAANDRNKNGSLEPGEQKSVYQTAFQYCGNYHFFTFIRQGQGRSNPTAVSDFSAAIRDGHLVYRFFVDLSAYGGQDIYLAVYDYTFYCDIRYEKDGIILNLDGDRLEASYEVGENKDYPVYYNPMGAADDTTIYYKWRKGLLTFYPLEVHLSYRRKD